LISTLYALLFYTATILMVVGIVRRIWTYWRTPVPLKIALTPAPTTKSGVVLRMAREVVFFETLFKSNKWIWLFGWMFHFGLLLVLLRHLRYFTQPVWGWISFIQPLGIYAGFAMFLGLLGLLVRRIAVNRVRYISAPSDYLMLLLLLGIGLSGMMLKFVAHTDIVAIKAFFIGLMRFDLQPLPIDLFVLVHLGLVVILMLIFPISKLMHAPGLFFAPSRTMVDNPREQRYAPASVKGR
jgi:nitrate reductase gamma subunit